MDKLKVNSYDSSATKVNDTSNVIGKATPELTNADKNTDTMISEEELVEFVDENISQEGAFGNSDEIALLQLQYNEELKQKRLLQQQLINLNSQRASLEAQLSNCDDEDEKKRIQGEIDSVDGKIDETSTSINKCATNLSNINQQILTALTKSIIANSNNTTGVTSNSSVGSPSVVETIPQELASKLDAKLGNGFAQKCEEVAKRLGCNPNDLLAMMYSESGIDPGCVASNGATGLIMFMPSTLSGNGYSQSEVANMSGVEQLDVVEDILMKSKTMSGYSADAQIDAGTLYALCFLPAVAQNEVLCSTSDSLSWAYNANSPLDLDGNGDISKTDLAGRLSKKYDEMYSYFVG